MSRIYKITFASRVGLLITVFLLSFGILKAYSRTTSTRSSSKHITLVTYSKDRPLQLFSFLESATKYLKGDYEIVVIYVTSKDSFERGYRIVKETFPKIRFRKQKSSSDLKKLTLESLYNRGGDYFLFGVDDVIVKDYVDLNRCVRLLEQTGAFGFYLRLGKNITECYSMNVFSGLPPLTKVDAGVYTWQFLTGNAEWRHMGNFDMTLYRKKDVKRPLTLIEYLVPNACEAAWNDFTDVRLYGLCFEQSKIVNIPLNIVQSYAKGNRHMALYTPEQLLEKFIQGYKIDIAPVSKIVNRAPHMEYRPKFVKR